MGVGFFVRRRVQGSECSYHPLSHPSPPGPSRGLRRPHKWLQGTVQNEPCPPRRISALSREPDTVYFLRLPVLVPVERFFCPESEHGGDTPGIRQEREGGKGSGARGQEESCRPRSSLVKHPGPPPVRSWPTDLVTRPRAPRAAPRARPAPTTRLDRSWGSAPHAGAGRGRRRRAGRSR